MTYLPIQNISDYLEQPPKQDGATNYIPPPAGSYNRGQRALATAVQKVLEAPDGTKHDTLNKMCFLLGGYVGTGELSETEAVQAMKHAIRNRGNVDNLEEADRTIIRGIQDGKAKSVPPDDWINSSPQPRALRQVPQKQQTTLEEIKVQIQKALIDFNEELPPPPVCLEVEQNGCSSILGVLGDFTLVTGKAKSRKTFFITVLIAAAISNGNVLGIIKGCFPENKRVALFFDTEQSRFYVLKAAKRVLNLAGPGHERNFMAYSLRKNSPRERLQIIEETIYNTPNVGVVVIDGIRDLITSINDEEQAYMIASKLLKWTEELNIHIVCVLHQNKGNTDPRGHVGSELTNKAGLALSVAKDTNDKEISVVTAADSRNKDFEPFAFNIDSNGIPQLVDHWNIKSDKSGKGSSQSAVPTDWPDDTHKKLLKKAFQSVKNPKYGQLISQVNLSLNEYGIQLGINNVKKFVKWYQDKGFITKQGKDRTKDCFYQLEPLV